MRRNRLTTTLALVAAALLMAACDSHVLYHETMHVDEEGWNMDEKLVYNLETEDTVSTYVCFLDIRNRNDYPFSNIYFFVKTIYPNGEVAVDTNIEFTLADPDGRWRGKNNGRYVDGRYPLCYFHFPDAGKYQFVIQHAMRDTVLRGVKDVAMHVERM